jgi:hypothetical protein
MLSKGSSTPCSLYSLKVFSAGTDATYHRWQSGSAMTKHETYPFFFCIMHVFKDCRKTAKVPSDREGGK